MLFRSWLAARQELRPPGGPDSTPIPTIDDALAPEIFKPEGSALISPGLKTQIPVESAENVSSV